MDFLHFLIEFTDREGSQRLEFFESAEIDGGDYYINGRTVDADTHGRITKAMKEYFLSKMKSPQERMMDAIASRGGAN